MSPQRELGGAQSLASNQKRLNVFGYCLKLFGGNSVLFVNPPTGVGGSKLSSSVLTRESFSHQHQSNPLVFMSPQRELGGAQSPAENPNRFNMFGYCLKLFSGTAFCLLTPPTGVGGSKLSFSVLMRVSFSLQLQPKPIVFMSPQRELGVHSHRQAIRVV